jgi:putative heme-binding domain-containing protein
VALALRGHQGDDAARLWTSLALQHDGRDRWYLEALGIGAEGQWDPFFAAWKQAAGDAWKSAAGRDIVWRARADAALPLLAELIRDPATTPADRARYFRAFDFHRGPARQRALLSLLDGAPDQSVTTLVLAALDTADVASSPTLRAALERTLDATRGTQEFVELIRKYDVRDPKRADELLRLALAKPEQSEGVEAARIILRRSGIAPFRALVEGDDAELASTALTVVGHAGGGASDAFLEEVALNPARPLALRLTAARLWAPGWSGSVRMVKVAQEGKLPDDMKPVVADLLRNSFRPQVRDAAIKLWGATPLTTADGKTLPDIDALAVRTGDRARGRVAFQRTCATCHSATPGAAPVFGPGLSEIGSKLAKPALYTAILHPSSGIAFGYEGTVLRLRDGSQVVGIVASETPDEVSLRVGPGIVTKYKKSEIASRAKLDRSLMPEGLARGLTEQQLVDVVEYLASLRKGER